MSIGVGVVLFVIGAILAFAVNVQVSGVDLKLIGDILMVAGVVVAAISAIVLVSRRKSVSTSSASVDANGNQVRRTETVNSNTDGLV